MLIEMPDGWKLEVFEQFIVDHNLPKFRDTEEADLVLTDGDSLGSGSYSGQSLRGPRVRHTTPTQRARRRRQLVRAFRPTPPGPPSRVKPSWIRRILDVLWTALLGEDGWRQVSRQGLDSMAADSLFDEVDPRSDDAPLGVLEFFSAVKEGTERIDLVQERAAGFELVIASARSAGQEALLEQLLGRAAAVRAETRLQALGFDRYLTEETLVEFALQSSRGLRLDWVGNFARIIPPDVIEKKLRCDGDHIFDAWVVLHYDPDGKATAMTKSEREEEVARKRDPILFGLLEGSRRLYYIADWDDEYCDLTLEKLAEEVGRNPAHHLRMGDYLGTEQ